ncbi:MAG TPA: phosphate ABC transporter permease subunit PstC [Candidatus Aquilonibacter sp.]|nr:phosphate ABC transporter permease subunit PstC [Candidatus Aquilonibacter sp.]
MATMDMAARGDSAKVLSPAALQRIPAQLIFRVVTGIAALVTFGLIFVMLFFLVVYAYPAIRFNGLEFLTSSIWNIGNQYGSGVTTRNGFTGAPGASFGALVFIFGSIVSALLTMVISVPLSLAVALSLVYTVPRRIRPLANALVELMAGIPSVVYGLWGLVVLVPWIANAFGPFVTSKLGWIPFLGGQIGSGNGLIASVFILSLMVIPIMVATTRDVILSQSNSIFEASMALGSSSWQAMTRAVLPSVRAGVVASILLAFGRAIGETMAVLMVCGAAINVFPQNIFSPVNTIAAVIVSQLESALTDSTGMAQRSLAELACVLFVITLIINVIARGIMRGADRAEGRKS